MRERSGGSPPEGAMTCSVFIATSLDGFIARQDGALDWLPHDTSEPHGYDEFIATVDAIVIGRKTFETVLTFDTWPYGRHNPGFHGGRPDSADDHHANPGSPRKRNPPLRATVARRATPARRHQVLSQWAGPKRIRDWLNPDRSEGACGDTGPSVPEASR